MTYMDKLTHIVKHTIYTHFSDKSTLDNLQIHKIVLNLTLHQTSNDQLDIEVFLDRPGLLIGLQGCTIRNLTKSLEEETGISIKLQAVKSKLWDFDFKIDKFSPVKDWQYFNKLNLNE